MQGLDLLLSTQTAKGTCDTHGPWSIETLAALANKATCPHCATESREREDRERAKAMAQTEDAKRRRRIEGLLMRASIPPRYANRSFEHYTVAGELQGKVLQRCQRYAENFPEVYRRGANLALCGRPGTGKTHLACAIANHVIREHGLSAVFARVMQVISSIQASYKDPDKTLLQALGEWLGPDLLVLDEIGVQRGSADEFLLLSELLSQRYDQCKPTILLSNLDRDGLAHYLGERVIERLEEDGGSIIVCNWESYRKQVLGNDQLPRRERLAS